MNIKDFDNIADKIEERMKQIRAPVRCIGGRFYPIGGFIEYIIEPSSDGSRSTKIDTILNATGDIANAIKTSAVRIFTNRQAEIILEVQLFNPPPPKIDDLICNCSKYCLVMGRDRIGNPLQFNLNDPGSAHLLVSGSTGSGKTAMAHSILIACAKMHKPSEIDITIIDPNSPPAEWLMPEISNHVVSMPDTESKAAQELSKIVAQMYKRPIGSKSLVYVDEMAGLCSENPVALKAIETIAQQGRKFGVHLLGCTQKPSVSVIGSLMKSNMRRAVGKVASPEDSKVASGLAGLGAESLSGNGQFIYVDQDRSRFQAALPNNYGVYNHHLSKQTFTPQETRTTTIDKSMVEAVVSEIKKRGEIPSKSKVLREMGLSTGGKHWSLLSEMWDEVR